MGVVSRFAVFLVDLDPTAGHEIQKTRPCLVVSPDQMNRNLQTVTVAPMTTKGRSYPSRIPVTFQGKEGQIVLDQLRTVDRIRLRKHLGVIDNGTANLVLAFLQEMFAP